MTVTGLPFVYGLGLALSSIELAFVCCVAWSCRIRTQPKTNMGSTYRPCLEPRFLERARRQGRVGALFLSSYRVLGGSGSAVPRWSMRCANHHVLAAYSALLRSNLLTGLPSPKPQGHDCQGALCKRELLMGKNPSC